MMNLANSINPKPLSVSDISYELSATGQERSLMASFIEEKQRLQRSQEDTSFMRFGLRGEQDDAHNEHDHISHNQDRKQQLSLHLQEQNTHDNNVTLEKQHLLKEPPWPITPLNADPINESSLQQSCNNSQQEDQQALKNNSNSTTNNGGNQNFPNETFRSFSVNETSKRQKNIFSNVVKLDSCTDSNSNSNAAAASAPVSATVSNPSGTVIMNNLTTQDKAIKAQGRILDRIIEKKNISESTISEHVNDFLKRLRIRCPNRHLNRLNPAAGASAQSKGGNHSAFLPSATFAGTSGNSPKPAFASRSCTIKQQGNPANSPTTAATISTNQQTARSTDSSVLAIPPIAEHLLNDCSTSAYYTNLPKRERIQWKRDRKSNPNRSRSLNARGVVSFSRGLSMMNVHDLIYCFVRPVLLPFDRVTLIWDAIFMLFTCVFLYFYSILMFFAQHVENQSMFFGYFEITICLFGVDILVGFHKAYIHADRLVTDLNEIMHRYLRSYFPIDAISIAVLIYKLIFEPDGFTHNPNDSFLHYAINFLVLLKAFTLPEKRRNLSNAIVFKNYQKHIISLVDQICIVIISAHFMGTLWNGVAVLEDMLGFEMNWQRKIGISSKSWYEIYMYSFYWAITTMSTVGYGDITATNAMECLFVTCAMLLMSCIFAYSIMNVGLILQEIEKDQNELNYQISTIHKFLKSKGVGLELQTRVKHYLNYLAEESRDRNKVGEDGVLELLSSQLREEVKREINSSVLNRCSIFSNNFSAKVNDLLVLALEEVLIQPNQPIFNANDIDDPSIYFVYSGKVEIYHAYLTAKEQPASHVIATLEAKAIFGQFGFFTGMARQASARSVNLATLYRISRAAFLGILESFPEDFERFKMISESIQFQNELAALQIECYACRSNKHTFAACPQLHCILDRQFVTLKSNFSAFQHRCNQYPRISRIKSRRTLQAKSLVVQNVEIVKRLKQHAVYMGSGVFEMFNDSNDSEARNSNSCTESSEKNSGSSNSSSCNEETSKDWENLGCQKAPSITLIGKSRSNSVLNFSNSNNAQQYTPQNSNSICNNNASEFSPRPASSSQRTLNQKKVLQPSPFAAAVSLPGQSSNSYSELCLKQQSTPSKHRKQSLLSFPQQVRTEEISYKHQSEHEISGIGQATTIAAAVAAVELFTQQSSELIKSLRFVATSNDPTTAIAVGQPTKKRPHKNQNQNKNKNRNSKHSMAKQQLQNQLGQQQNLLYFPTMWQETSCYQALSDFDKMKQFKRFFPKNNIDNVLKLIKASQITIAACTATAGSPNMSASGSPNAAPATAYAAQISLHNNQQYHVNQQNHQRSKFSQNKKQKQIKMASTKRPLSQQLSCYNEFENDDLQDCILAHRQMQSSYGISAKFGTIFPIQFQKVDNAHSNQNRPLNLDTDQIHL